MEKIQINNYIIEYNEELIIFKDVAGTWKSEMTFLHSKFALVSKIITDGDKEKYLEAYVALMFILAQQVPFDQKFMGDFIEIANSNIKRSLEYGKE